MMTNAVSRQTTIRFNLDFVKRVHQETAAIRSEVLHVLVRIAPGLGTRF